MRYTAGEIAAITGGILYGEASAPVSGVSTDSRAVHEGDCFWAIKGENFDGNDFAESVITGGGRCAVASRVPAKIPAGASVVQVSDSIAALGLLAGDYRGRLKAKVIGITGSVGKTSTRNMLGDILSQKYRTHRAKKSFNNHIGLPLTILETPRDCEMLIVEMGTNHPGEIEYLTRIARPNIALVTAVTEAHLEGFGSIEAIAAEKASIALGLSGSDSLLIINAAMPVLTEAASRLAVPTAAFGFGGDYDFAGSDPLAGIESGSFVIGNTRVCVPLAGRGNLENALAAWAVCSSLGMEAADFAGFMQNVRAENMRMNIIETPDITIIADCYNANPASMQNAIDYLGLLKESSGRLVFVAGYMGELGSETQRLHRKLGAAAADAGIDLLLAAGPLADVTVNAAREMSNKLNAYSFESTEQLCSRLEEYICRGDAVLVKGSRSMRLEAAVEKLEKLKLKTKI
ncbi:UDP-N-acetylmuramoyl-tripeptide--D-alanyl-D-alanine ligase [Limihaloglobus sulfuriphilus]|uniref:UDP-N-acetylmuramoyl-tripeptide--D-alanyl-D-alanine ligase n=1 Tax=Limihaloglobus sulfuriphilus TaxID=1851148 RepID=A0A1Q2MF74_9BACT|nr:UDP-N-acetylmuramoyl-tripeptide--D-alanyl-D-alanine ligase [Limihaloglobus sulfuriphilus]AQQ71351.1 UDP-N-acetylmuramoyl-tripeptide--D-alanyl-D-alanine ligase [Limihaloglobus sulfuriphilus]